MNFGTLSSNEKLAVYGAVAAIIGVVIASFLAGLAWLTLIAGIAMLVVVFLPQLSSGTDLPGSKGSLMFVVGIVGGVAGALALLVTLTSLGALLGFYTLQTLFLLIGVAGGLVMAWAGWQELQAEGGSFRFGTEAGTAATAGTTDAHRTEPPADTQRGEPPTTSAPTATTTTGMGSTGPASTSAGATNAGSTDMGAEGGPARREEESPYRDPNR